MTGRPHTTSSAHQTVTLLLVTTDHAGLKLCTAVAHNCYQSVCHCAPAYAVWAADYVFLTHFRPSAVTVVHITPTQRRPCGCCLRTNRKFARLGQGSVLQPALQPPQVRLSVSDLSPPSSPGFTAELNHNNGPCVLRRIRTMRRRFGDRSAGSSVLSPSQLDRARTTDRVGSGIISGT